VHWEPQNDRFFCPCHLGTFDPEGRPTGGPPLSANQSLPEYPLRVEKGLLYISMPIKPIDETTYRRFVQSEAERTGGTPRASGDGRGDFVHAPPRPSPEAQGRATRTGHDGELA
jgi:phenylpropionate dioxygenase-like ring-hydroxylating dioxygenase large terminal subunit